MGGASAALQRGQAALATQRSGGGADDEQGRALDEHGRGRWLVAVGLEGLQLVELEGPEQRTPLQTIPVKRPRMERQPAEAMLNGAAGDSERLGRLPLPHATHHEVEEPGVEVRFLVPVIGPEALARERAVAGTAAEAGHRAAPALRMIPPLPHEKPARRLDMKRAGWIRTTSGMEHGDLRTRGSEVDERSMPARATDGSDVAGTGSRPCRLWRPAVADRT